MSISKLYECIKRKKVNISQAREAICDVLLQGTNCMSVSEMTEKLEEGHHKKISLNTIYRHLGLFVECDLVVVIQDYYKKAYYTPTLDKALVFSLCPKCNDVSMVKDTSSIEKMLSGLKSSEFITLHKRCATCA